MEQELLIEEVRSRPVLWDTSLEIYRDNVLKDKAWEEIGEVLSKDKSSLKQQWKELKDCHRQALQRRKTTTGQAAAKIKKWKYEEEMKFLLSTMTHRPSDTNILLPDQPEQPEGLEGPEDQEENEEGDVEEGVQDQHVEGDDDVGSIGGDDDTGEEVPATGKERRNRSPRGIEKVLTFMKTKEKTKSERPKKCVPNEIDLFFASAAQSVKKLPRRLQNKIKMELLSNICQAEEENERTMSNPGTSFVHTQIPNPGFYPETFIPRVDVPRSGPANSPYVPSPSPNSVYSRSSTPRGDMPRSGPSNSSNSPYVPSPSPNSMYSRSSHPARRHASIWTFKLIKLAICTEPFAK